MTATVANIKIRYDAKTPQLAIFGTCVIFVFYSICIMGFRVLRVTIIITSSLFLFQLFLKEICMSSLLECFSRKNI